AEQIMRQPSVHNSETPVTVSSERSLPEEEEDEEGLLQAKRDSHGPTTLENSLLRAQGGGRALPETERAFFEAQLGHDFQHVRIHSDNSAARAAHTISAEAFTYGRDIFFCSK